MTKVATLLPGIRTTSWDIALTGMGTVPLEVNFGGDSAATSTLPNSHPAPAR